MSGGSISVMFIYVMTNEIMPGFCKVGISSDVDRRAAGLYGPWKVVCRWAHNDAQLIEARVKRRMRDFLAFGAELFNCPAEVLIKVVESEIDGAPLPVVEKREKTPGRYYVANNPADLGKLVKRLRNEQKLRQPDLATSCGTGIRFIGDLERGKETCEIGKAFEAIKQLGASILIEMPE